MCGMEGCEGGRCETECGSEMQCSYESREVDYARTLAFWVKKEILKDKVKQRMETKYGKKLDKIADLIVEIVTEKAKNAKELGNKGEELKAAFGDLEGEN